MKQAPVATDSSAEEYRERLLAGMLEALFDVGWADLTIAEIVRRARVSKRTFYEHFATKEACLLALYESESARLLDALDAAIELVPRGEGRVTAGARLYLEYLRSRPRVIRTVTIEILHLGSEGLAVRRGVMRRFAGLLQREINAVGVDPPISSDVASMIVGGINELALEALEADRVDRLADLAEPISDLIGRVLRAGSATAANVGRPANMARPRRR